MIKVSKIIKILEKFAPLALAAEWDNSGWQINLGNEQAKNIMLCLSVTPKVIQQAIDNNCDLIISHHPLIFNKLNTIDNNIIGNTLIIDCIKNNIQVYSAHTNLDKTKGGVNDTLCEVLGLNPISIKDEYVRISKLPTEMSLDDFILKLKISLNASKLKIINPDNISKIKKIAVCGGSGGEFVNFLDNVDAFVTGDIKYHTALEVKDMVLIDAGHFATERIILQTLKNLLLKETKNILIAKENEPWIIV